MDGRVTPKKRLGRRVNAAMRVRVLDESDQEYRLTKNISIGGVFFITDRRYPIGQYLDLEIDYKGVLVETGARVTHTQRDGVGVRFWDAPAKLRHTLRSMIEDLLAAGLGELRREQRVCIEETPVIWRQNELEHRGELLNLSLSGAGIRCSDVPHTGDEIVIMIPTPAADLRVKSLDLVGTHAHVRQSEQEVFGVEFDTPSAEFRLAVARLLQESGETSIRQV